MQRKRNLTRYRKMNINKHKRMVVAWMLLVTFMSVLVIKDSHFHHVPDNAVASASTDGYGQTVQGACFICDFTLHKAGVVTMADFHPLLCFTIVTPYTFISQTVYRHIDAVNSHSPPAVA